MDNRTVVGALSIQLNAACILCTLIYWLSQSELEEIRPYPLVLLVYGPLLYGLDRLFLRRERTLRDLVLLNAGAGLAFFAVLVPLVRRWAHHEQRRGRHTLQEVRQRRTPERILRPHPRRGQHAAGHAARVVRHAARARALHGEAGGLHAL